MTLQQLAYFAEAYRQGSISKAAENLYVAHQTISAAIQKLETEFNVTLFHRSANRITPTAAGDDFYTYAIPLLNDEVILRQNMQKHLLPANEKLSAKIGLSDVISSLYGDELVEKLSDAFPNYHFTFYQITYVDDALAYIDYDIFISHFPNPASPELLLKNSDNYLAYHLGENKFYVWISADSPLSKLPVITAEHLKNHSSLVLKNVFNSSMISHFYSSGHIYNIKLKTAFAEFLENAPCYALDAHLNHGKLLYADILANKNVVLKETDQISHLSIIYKKSAELFLPTIAPVIS